MCELVRRSMEREVLRCSSCSLVQFMTRNELCRKCQKPLRPQPEPEPVVEVTFRPRKALEAKQREMRERMANRRPLCLGLIIYLVRIGRELSQRELALKMSCQRTYISLIEQDKAVPALKQIDRFADALEVSPRFLVELAEVQAQVA